MPKNKFKKSQTNQSKDSDQREINSLEAEKDSDQRERKSWVAWPGSREPRPRAAWVARAQAAQGWATRNPGSASPSHMRPTPI